MLTSSRLGSRSSIDAPPAQAFRRAWRPGAKAHSTIRGSTTCGAASTRHARQANERVYGVLTTADTQASELHGSIQAKDGVSVAANPPSSSSILYRFVVPSYETRFGENLVVVGDLDELGSWQLEAAASMSWQEGHRWVLEARLPRRSFEFKVVVVSGSSVRWEQGVNRVIQAEGSLAEVPVELVINLTCHFDLTHATPLELELNRSSIQSKCQASMGQGGGERARGEEGRGRQTSFELAKATLELMESRRNKLAKALGGLMDQQQQQQQAARGPPPALPPSLHQGLGQVQPGPGLIAGQLQSAADENRVRLEQLGAAVARQASSVEELQALVEQSVVSEDGQLLRLSLKENVLALPRELASLASTQRDTFSLSLAPSLPPEALTTPTHTLPSPPASIMPAAAAGGGGAAAAAGEAAVGAAAAAAAAAEVIEAAVQQHQGPADDTAVEGRQRLEPAAAQGGAAAGKAGSNGHASPAAPAPAAGPAFEAAPAAANAAAAAAEEQPVAPVATAAAAAAAAGPGGEGRGAEEPRATPQAPLSGLPQASRARAALAWDEALRPAGGLGLQPAPPAALNPGPDPSLSPPPLDPTLVTPPLNSDSAAVNGTLTPPPPLSRPPPLPNLAAAPVRG
ncbi:hypothetical protein QJQ45_029432, partial [Haematococcus lacustris]